MPILNKKNFSRIKLRIPNKYIQDKIVKILKQIDDKVLNNHNINSRLEQLSKTFFKSWFVDFDPVHAKKLALEKGLSQEQSERAAMASIFWNLQSQ